MNYRHRNTFQRIETKMFQMKTIKKKKKKRRVGESRVIDPYLRTEPEGTGKQFIEIFYLQTNK